MTSAALFNSQVHTGTRSARYTGAQSLCRQQADSFLQHPALAVRQLRQRRVWWHPSNVRLTPSPLSLVQHRLTFLDTATSLHPSGHSTTKYPVPRVTHDALRDVSRVALCLQSGSAPHDNFSIWPRDDGVLTDTKYWEHYKPAPDI